MSHPFVESIGQLLLGSDPRQRRHLSRYFLSAGVYAFSMLAELGLAWAGLVPPLGAAVVVAAPLVTIVGFYVAIRSSFSRRFADPALTALQMSSAIVFLSLAYAMNPAARGMLLMIVALVLIYGAFTLSAASCRRLGWFSVAMLGLTMGVSSWRAPGVFTPLVELAHFVTSAVVLPIIAILAGQLSRMRYDLHTQKVELREALERIRLLASRDELTGLPNRRHVQSLLDDETRRTHGERAPLCVCLIDLDHFKRVNDTLGHAAGDEVLRRVASQAGLVLREADVFARWGGEEFLLLLPETRLAEAKFVVERLRQHLGRPETWRERPELRVTFSAGIAAHRAGESMQDTIARADDALYRAKTTGRNRALLAA